MRKLLFIGALLLSFQTFGQVDSTKTVKDSLINGLSLQPRNFLHVYANLVGSDTLVLYRKERLKDVDDLSDIIASQVVINPLGIVPVQIDSTITTERKPVENKYIWAKGIWIGVNKIGLDLSEVAFVNWNSGGSNSISALLGLAMKRNYSTPHLHWNNELFIEYGINKQKDTDLRKTDDKIEINSTIGYKKDSLSNWFYSAKFNFRTQITSGYKYPNTKTSISDFMSPAYLFLGVGSEYNSKENNLEFYLSPLTMKTTFVLNQRLANSGAFGVKPAIYDANGKVIREGRNSRNQIGILLTNEYHTEIVNNIVLNNKLSLYTDYINKFGNVDINWELNFRFRVNEYVVAKLGSHLKYDDDIKRTVEDENGETHEEGPSIQWKQQLGIGVVVSL